MVRGNGALVSLVRFSCRVYRTHTSPLVSVSLSLSRARTSAVKFCWNLCIESAKRSGTYLGVFFLFILGEEFRVFSRCVDRWCIRNRVPRKWTRGAGIGWRGSSNTFSLVCPCASLLNPDKELNLSLAGRTCKLFCNKGTAGFKIATNAVMLQIVL
jgi:hypothetical protein